MLHKNNLIIHKNFKIKIIKIKIIHNFSQIDLFFIDKKSK